MTDIIVPQHYIIVILVSVVIALIISLHKVCDDRATTKYHLQKC